MRYWDSSALVPLCVAEARSREVSRFLDDDPEMVSWWTTPVECFSALCRLKREGVFPDVIWLQAKRDFDELMGEIDLIPPLHGLRDRSLRLLSMHPLRAGDALQLAAALHWCQEQTRGVGFVCLDDRLRQAASLEGFAVFP